MRLRGLLASRRPWHGTPFEVRVLVRPVSSVLVLPASAVLLPLASVAPGTRVRLVGEDERHADPLEQLGLVVVRDGPAPWAVAWRTVEGLDDPAVYGLREALLPGGWIVVAFATDTPAGAEASTAALVARMEDVGLVLADATAHDRDADGTPIVRGLFRRVDPGVIA